jgi:hypothetical protein
MLAIAAVLFTLFEATSQGQCCKPLEDGTKLISAYVGRYKVPVQYDLIVPRYRVPTYSFSYLRLYCAYSLPVPSVAHLDLEI